MDHYVEEQCVEKIKAGEARQFLLLFDAQFEELYKYVARRVIEVGELETMVRLTFLDALSMLQDIPRDTTFLSWLFSLARPRVFNYIARVSMPLQRGLISKGLKELSGDEMLERAEKMMAKLSLEEREILRLKFFEQVSDGDVVVILGVLEADVGAKIYRVLKRAHFLLFGESDERQGVYFGELSGFFEKARNMEAFSVPNAFRLSLRADIAGRIERREFAIDAEYTEEPKPFVEHPPSMGSGDPAKIFVDAVAEMRKEEATAREFEVERGEVVLEFVERWKSVLMLAPMVLFVSIVSFVLYTVFGYMGGVERGYATVCPFEVDYEESFADGRIRDLYKNVANPLCNEFKASAIRVGEAKPEGFREEVVNVEVEYGDETLHYYFAKEGKNWRVKRYARYSNSDGEHGEV